MTSKEVKCWWRYNNQGGRYKTCDDGSGKPKKEQKKYPPPITTDEFETLIDKYYTDMTDVEKREWHRLDMAHRRREKREELDKIREALKSETKLQKERLVKKRREEMEEKKKDPTRFQFKGDRLNEYLEQLKDDYKSGRKLPAKSSIRKRVGDKKFEKLMKKYEDAVFK